jgi:hypothetical protein
MKVSITYKYKQKDKVNVSVAYDDLCDGDVMQACVAFYTVLPYYWNLLFCSDQSPFTNRTDPLQLIEHYLL